MKTTLYTTLVLALILLIGCTQTDKNDPSIVLEAINLIRENHVKAVNTTDLESVLVDMSPEVVYLAPGIKPIEGKEALRQFLAPIYEFIKPNIEMTPHDIKIISDVAIEWGIINGEISQDGSDSSQHINSKYLFVYERSENGKWLITRDIYNEILEQAE